jgi:VanZ family protein
VKPRSKNLKWLVVGMGIAYSLLVLSMGLAWYKDQLIEPFHFFNDLPEWKQLDKLAHFCWSFQVSALVFRLLKWGGWQSVKVSSIIGFALVSSVEIPDGFSAGYGASLFDIVANALGACCFFLQLHFWKSVKIFAKFSFHPTAFAIQRPSLLGDGFTGAVEGLQRANFLVCVDTFIQKLATVAFVCSGHRCRRNDLWKR